MLENDRNIRTVNSAYNIVKNNAPDSYDFFKFIFLCLNFTTKKVINSTYNQEVYKTMNELIKNKKEIDGLARYCSSEIKRINEFNEIHLTKLDLVPVQAL